ncbi:MAG: 4-alpha-glucanotransferase [Planctomycetes bacterium]|nr:4-alpha-glucanotransferase [Planctomycetota bacterium]
MILAPCVRLLTAVLLSLQATPPPDDLSLSKRSSGVLLHPTSLPSSYGMGDLGPASFEFVDFLSASGQKWWQMLPVVPTGPGNAPYASPSAFAGNPMLLSPERLVAEGLLSPADLPARRPVGPVDYGDVWQSRQNVLHKAFAAFRPDADFQRFRSAKAGWLNDHALFFALKEERGGAPWWEWEPELRQRDPAVLAQARQRLAAEVQYHEFLQYEFDRQWSALRQHVASKGIGLIGDLPIYVSHDSADVWAHQDQFELDAQGRTTRVAGVPPDVFSKDGQLWGNPLYRWDVMKQRGYDWWVNRMRVSLERFDAVRLDHFIGFERFWAVPAGATSAKGGQWQPGPSADLFTAINAALGQPRIIAEDLGTLTPEVHALRDRFGFPGMRVLQFSFDTDFSSTYHQARHHPANSIVYTGTHDNNTTVGWFRDNASPDLRRQHGFALRQFGTDGSQIHWDVIKEAMRSPANLAIVPAQDLLGLDESARMNVPGKPKGNWEWRMAPGALTPAIGSRLRVLSAANGRVAGAQGSNARAPSFARATAEGIGTFGLAYVFKEGLNAAESLDAERFAESMRAMGRKEWWIGIGAFSVVSHGVDRWVPMGGFARAVVPMTAGMAAAQLALGGFDPKGIGIATGAYSLSGTAVETTARLLGFASPGGWVSKVIKLGLGLYLGDKLDRLAHRFLSRKSAAAMEGVEPKLSALGAVGE